MKMTGADWKEFINEPTVWYGEDVYVEELHVLVDGKDYPDDNGDDTILFGGSIPDTAVVDIRYGYLVWQGRTPQPTNFQEDMLKAAKDFMRKQTTSRLVIEFRKESLAQVLAMLQEHKIKVLS